MAGAETFAESRSQTFTIADVGKVLDCFAADLDGVGQSTGLRTRENTKAVAGDVKLMAQSKYLAEANIYLEDSAGEIIRAAKYVVSTNGSLLTASRPGNYLWPRTPGGELGVVVRYTQAWRDLSEEQKTQFKQRLSGSWGTVSFDTSFPMLTPQHDRNYVRNGYGLQKTLFS